MDELNAHQFWGISPAIDLNAVLRVKSETAVDDNAPLKFLQVATYDARHSLYTLCRLARHPSPSQTLQLFVYEEEPESLVRHILLVSILLDGSLMVKERMETLLELHGNVLLREKTARYLEERARAIEHMLITLSSKGGLPTAVVSKAGTGSSSPDGSDGLSLSDGMATLAQILDISLLKFQDRDRLVEVLQRYRQSSEYDMVKAWDARSRKWYGDRYDARRNMIDWDYHMPLLSAGTPGQDPSHGSIIHFHHFRYWRMHGIAYELRDAQYNHPNRSLLSTAVGRTREFKDRYGKDVGRSVAAWGYWGDIVNSPYHAFGTVSEDGGLFKYSNKQFSRTAVDLAEHNILALLHELRTGERYTSAGGEAHRARVARGPTSMADLQEESAKSAKVKEQIAADKAAAADKAVGQGEGAAAGPEQGRTTLPVVVEEAEEAAAGQGEVGPGAAGRGVEAVASQVPQGNADKVQDAEGAQGSHTDSRQDVGESEGVGTISDGGGAATGDNEVAAFIPSVTFQGPKPGFHFKRGKQGIGYYADVAPAAAQTQAVAPAAGKQAGSSDAACPSDVTSPAEPPAPVGQSGSNGSSDSSSSSGGKAAAAQTGRSPPEATTDAQRAQMSVEEEALRAAEAQLDAEAASRLLQGGRIKIVPVLGGGEGASGGVGGGSMLAKLLTSRAKFAGAFQVAAVGHRHVHLLRPEHQLLKAVAPGGLVVVENAHNMLQLNKEQSSLFNEKLLEMAVEGGFKHAKDEEALLRKPMDGCPSGMTLTEAHTLLVKPEA